MDFQSAYSKPFRGSDLECKDVSLSQQSFKDETDINVLLERFKVTGQMPQGVVLPQYGDFAHMVDFRTAQEAIRKANGAFMDLPANIRARFNHDPASFVDFCSDKANLPELRKLGLAPEALDAVRGDGGHVPHGDAPEAPKV